MRQDAYMAHADFSERHYELAINLELIREANEYFVPSQNEEAKLGYDIALVPALPRIWSSLTAGLPGIGATTGEVVPKATSLFLQYKRPEFISNRNGKESGDRETAFEAPVPYYRFKLEQAQLDVLLDLRASSAGKASVCYAAGIFHKRTDFYSYKLASRVAENSIFLSLDDLKIQLNAAEEAGSASKDHRWTYDVHGGRGLLCSDPRPLEGSSIRGLRDILREGALEAESVEDHVQRLTSQIQDWRVRSIEPARDRLIALPDAELGLWQNKFIDIEEASAAVKAQQTLDELEIGWFLAMPARRRQLS